MLYSQEVGKKEKKEKKESEESEKKEKLWGRLFHFEN